ncbi:AIPR family protein [Anaerovorax odorimutans]|uniref:AIPR family protein n=1 Tax=Anaerovorax odorimutans TaxID=109327 RepID=UPI000A0692B8|nr:AIPR family protein [Anaerovorax odorimutans]
MAPGNKASDLNTAAAWVFARDIESVPTQIRDSVQELQEAILNGDINSIYFWYVHNLNEKNNKDIQEELNTVQVAAQNLVNTFSPDTDIKIIALEVGNATIEKWYNSSNKRITIEDTMRVYTNKEGFEIAEDKWKACVTAVSGMWLRELSLKYKEDEIFSGNPRNFLGAGKRKNKINLGIMATVEDKPKNFWAYNNGITALVNDYTLSEEKDLIIKGITIINGAQTTGAVASVEKLVDDFWVPIRFIVCNDTKVIEEIINNNNKQNEILPSDLRSNDKQQERLRREFKKYPQLYYSGGRRDDKKPKNKEILDPYMVAQTVMAYHGDCVKAYNGKKAIWDGDKDYNFIFSDQLKVEHIIFVYSLSRAIDEYKIMLKNKREMRTDNENEQFDYLSKRGSKMLLIYTIAESMESVLQKKILAPWSIAFKDNNDFDVLVEKWKSVIKSFMSFNKSLLPALEGGLKNKEQVKQSAGQLVSMVNAIQEMLQIQLQDFIKAVDTDM